MNGRTVAEDMAQVARRHRPVRRISLPIAARRKDVTYYPMPVNKLIKAADLPHNLKDYVANMVYVGVLTHLLGIDINEIESALLWNFDGKRKPAQLNMDMVNRSWPGRKNAPQDRRFPRCAYDRLQRRRRIMADGNTAAALGAIFGGMSVTSWYPITPASSLAKYRQICAKAAHGSGHGPGNLRGHPGRRRTGGHRHGGGRGLGRGAGHDQHQRPRHEPDGRVCRIGLLCRNPRGGVECAARMGPSTGSPHARPSQTFCRPTT